MTFRELHTEIMNLHGVPDEHIIRMQRGLAAMGRDLNVIIPDDEIEAVRESMHGIISAMAESPALRLAIYLALKPEMDKRTQNN